MRKVEIKTVLKVKDTYFLVQSSMKSYVNETIAVECDVDGRILRYDNVLRFKPAMHGFIIEYVKAGVFFKTSIQKRIDLLYEERDDVLSEFESVALNDTEDVAVARASVLMLVYREKTKEIRELGFQLVKIEELKNEIAKIIKEFK